MKVKRLKTNALFLAFKNLFRHKTKTVITTLAIGLGVGAYLIMDAWLLGMNIDSQRNLVNFETGSAKIYSKKYFAEKDDYPLYEAFSGYEKIIEALNEKGYDAVPHAVFTGSLFGNGTEFPFKFIGVDPKLDSKVFKYSKWLEKDTGSRFVEDNRFEIALGIKGAKDLGVKAGDTVRLSTVIDKKDESGRIRHINQLIELTVCGIINSSDPVANGNIGYIPLSILQDEYGLLLEGHITELCIRKNNAPESALPVSMEKPAAIKKALGKNLPDDLLVVGWQEDAKDYLAASNSDNVFNRMIIVIFFIITLFGIANTMVMSVLERTKEIGMMKALGMTNTAIMKLFLTEAGMIGFIGALLGIVIALPVTYYLVYYGFDLSKMLEETGTATFGYRVLGIYKAAWNYSTMIGSVVVTAICSSATAFFPALRAVKIKIVDALRFE
jgi:ABC-type lipoprotein release transport system permease subunit